MTLFSLLGMIIIGFIVGLLARFLMPGKNPAGIVMTTLLGIGGSIVGTFLGQQLGWYQPGEGAGWIASIVGAVILLALYGLFRGKSQAA